MGLGAKKNDAIGLHKYTKIYSINDHGNCKDMEKEIYKPQEVEVGAMYLEVLHPKTESLEDVVELTRLHRKHYLPRFGHDPQDTIIEEAPEPKERAKRESPTHRLAAQGSATNPQEGDAEDGVFSWFSGFFWA